MYALKSTGLCKKILFLYIHILGWPRCALTRVNVWWQICWVWWREETNFHQQLSKLSFVSFYHLQQQQNNNTEYIHKQYSIYIKDTLWPASVELILLLHTYIIEVILSGVKFYCYWFVETTELGEGVLNFKGPLIEVPSCAYNFTTTQCILHTSRVLCDRKFLQQKLLCSRLLSHSCNKTIFMILRLHNKHSLRLLLITHTHHMSCTL